MARGATSVSWGRQRAVAILAQPVAARRQSRTPEAPLNSRFFRNGVVMLALVVVALAVVFTVVNQNTSNTDVAYSEFLNNVAKGQVTEVIQEGSTLTVTPTGGAPKYTV